MVKIYLAGAINGCTDEECKDWRGMIKSDWPFQSVDPMDRDYRGMELTHYREIVDLDKRDIRGSDVVVVNYVKPSTGTSMEVLYAWTIGKPVIIVAKEGERLSPWLIYHSTSITNSFEECRKKLEEI